MDASGMTSRWARVIRGTIAAALATFVAAFFHVATGGDVPNGLALALCLAFAIPACVLLTGKRLSLWRQTVSVALSQLLFHALFDLGSTGVSLRETGSTSGGMNGMHMPGSHLVLNGAAGSQQMDAMLPTDPWMLLGHTTAAVVTILALRHGEAAFWRMLELATLRIVRLVARFTPAPLPQLQHPPGVFRSAILRDLGVLLGGMRHRGPPLIAFR